MMKVYDLLLLMLLLIGCNAGDGSSLDENGQPLTTNEELPTTPTEDDGEIQANLPSLQQHIFTPICSVCHAGANAPFGLALDTLENSANNLLNIAAVGNTAFKRVEPGAKEQSFLYLKVIGDPQAGSRMPLNQAPLSDAAIEAIGQWIDAGASVNVEQVPLVVTKVSHDMAAHSLMITMHFSADVDPDSVSAEQILLTDLGQVLASPVKVIWQSSRLLTLMINKPLDVQQLVITLNQASISTITGKYGQHLDGDGDGWPGGEFSYVATF